MRWRRQILRDERAKVARAKAETEQTLHAVADQLIVLQCQVEQLREAMESLGVSFIEEKET